MLQPTPYNLRPVKTCFILAVSFLSSFLFIENTYAETPPKLGHPSNQPGPAVAPSNVQDYFINTFVPYFITAFSAAVGGLSFLFLVIGGVQYLIAYGEQEKLDNAKRTVTWAVLGLVLVLMSYAIVSIITTLPLPAETIPPPPSNP